MLSCLLNNQRINCYDYDKETLKKWANKNILTCPACGKPYEYCHGKVISPYFRHKDKQECTDKYSEPETEEHKIGKQDLYEWIKTQDGITDVILEGWIESTKQRPDIMFKYNGEQYVIEYQCSPISSEYYERHELYQASGIKDIWILGTEKYLEPEMRNKSIENNSFYYYNVSKKKLLINTESSIFDSFNEIYKKGLFGFTRHFYKNNNRLSVYSCDLKNFILKNNGIVHKNILKLEAYEIIYNKRIFRKNLKKEILEIEENKFKEKVKNINIINKYYSINSEIKYGRVNLSINIYYDKYFETYSNYKELKKEKSLYLQLNEIIKEIKEDRKEMMERVNKIDRSLFYFSKYNEKNKMKIVFGNKNRGYNFKYKKVIKDEDLYYLPAIEEGIFLEELIESLKFFNKRKIEPIIMLPLDFSMKSENYIFYQCSKYELIGYLYTKGFKNLEIIGD